MFVLAKLGNQARVTNNIQHVPLDMVESYDAVLAHHLGYSLEILSDAVASSVTDVDQVSSTLECTADLPM